jgi:hypothetical protein
VYVAEEDEIEPQMLEARTSVVGAQLWAAEHAAELLSIVTNAAATSADTLRLLTAPHEQGKA